MKKAILSFTLLLGTLFMMAHTPEHHDCLANHCTHATSTSCSCCYGTHQMDCTVCGGSGGRYEYIPRTEYDSYGNPYTVNDQVWYSCSAGCGGTGKVACTCCEGKSTTTGESLMATGSPSGFAVSSANLYGTWSDGQGTTLVLGTTYSASAGGRTLSIYRGNALSSGWWDVEDGLLKMGEWLGWFTNWKKFTIDDFDGDTLKISGTEAPFKTSILKKVK